MVLSNFGIGNQDTTIKMLLVSHNQDQLLHKMAYLLQLLIEADVVSFQDNATKQLKCGDKTSQQQNRLIQLNSLKCNSSDTDVYDLVYN